MSPALLEPPPRLSARPEPGRRFGRPRATLEERLERALCGTQRHGEAACPVCGDAMRAEGAAARCGGCGSVLS